MSDTLPNTDPATNARFVPLGNGTYAEIMSDQLQLFYNPSTGACRAIFNCKKYIEINGAYVELGGDMLSLEVDFTTKMDQCYGVGLVDPFHPETSLDTVSVASVMILAKAALDHEWNLEAQRIAQQIADAQSGAGGSSSGTTSSGDPSSGTSSSGGTASGA